MTDRRSGPHCQSRKLANAPTRQPDKLLRQPDLVYTVQDALALISQPQSVQVEPSDPSKASQQVTVLIETFPPVLIVYLKRFLYDIVAGGVVKNCKPVQFSPGLKIPPDIMVPTAGRPTVPARYMLNGVLYHCTTTRPQAEGIIRWTCSTGTHMRAVERLGCASTMTLYSAGRGQRADRRPIHDDLAYTFTRC